ncbi:hypothetical protein ACVBEH_18950 [Roseateles sp. GG27B]
MSREVSAARRAVHGCPDDVALALADLRREAGGAAGGGVTVIGQSLPLSASRAEARVAIRQALTQTLAAFFKQPSAAVTLVSRPGQALRVLVPGAAPVQISISHMAGFSRPPSALAAWWVWM